MKYRHVNFEMQIERNELPFIVEIAGFYCRGAEAVVDVVTGGNPPEPDALEIHYCTDQDGNEIELTDCEYTRAKELAGRQ